MINENSFLNQSERKQGVRSKEKAQQELIEKFGIRKTSDFRETLKKGNIELAEKWLNYIIENRENFPQYENDWDNWLGDRRKEVAQQELIEKFGIRKTSDFRETLKKGNIELAEKWLNYIIENRENFPQYENDWDNWLGDRKEELTNTKTELER